MAAPELFKVDQPRQLLVEGKDAKDFFEALVGKLGLDGFQVHNFGGIKEMRKFLKGFCAAPGFPCVRSIGVVRDAESSHQSAFQSVCDAIKNLGFATPRSPESGTGGKPSWSVLILPDASTPGMLESLCLRSIDEQPVMQCIRKYFACIAEVGVTPKNAAKAYACAFLASCPEPKPSVGIAAKAGYWPLDHPAFDHVRRFLQAM